MFSSAHLLFVGIFSSIQQQMLVRPTGEASPGNTISLLGRKIKHNGKSFAISFGKSYYSKEIIKEPGLEKRNPAPTPRTSSMKFTIADEELLDAEQHSTTLVGKLQWLSYTRPNMSYSIKELARSLLQP